MSAPHTPYLNISIYNLTWNVFNHERVKLKTQQAFSYSKLTIETERQCAKSVHN